MKHHQTRSVAIRSRQVLLENQHGRKGFEAHERRAKRMDECHYLLTVLWIVHHNERCSCRLLPVTLDALLQMRACVLEERVSPTDEEPAEPQPICEDWTYCCWPHEDKRMSRAAADPRQDGWDVYGGGRSGQSPRSSNELGCCKSVPLISFSGCRSHHV